MNHLSLSFVVNALIICVAVFLFLIARYAKSASNKAETEKLENTVLSQPVIEKDQRADRSDPHYIDSIDR